MPQSSPAIALYSVRKTFRTVVAVENASFEVQPGEIFGLLGPNGAGKTTLLRLIMDIFRPDSGSIQIFGHQLLKEDKGRIGYLPEERGLYTRQKVQAVIEYLVQLKGVPQPKARINTLDWLKRLDMLDVKDRRVQELSKGNQQKIQFIATVAADPEILVLDEPFSGLDPVNARALIQRDPATGSQRKDDCSLDAPDESCRVSLPTRVHDSSRSPGTLRRFGRDPKCAFR